MKLSSLLRKHTTDFHSVIPSELQHGPAYVFDLTAASSDFSSEQFNDIEELMNHSNALLSKNKAVIGIGPYAEKRSIYQRDELFTADARDIHLGIDLTVTPGTLVYSPTDAILHSVKNNGRAGDYGPVVILQHQIMDCIFYTLYGHLGAECLSSLHAGQVIKRGEAFATVGKHTENGGWPPHLHFQVIQCVGDAQGDFPGVTNAENQSRDLANCPDPNLILNIHALHTGFVN
jgi:murein DD-endopeptidase MepM/ murein hydrolase activator NlpD